MYTPAVYQADMDVTGPVSTTARSLRMLSYIDLHGPTAMGAICRDLDLSRSTAHEHINTLLAAGLVDRRGGHYVLGFRLYHLGERARQQVTGYPEIVRTVRQLADSHELEIDFSVRADAEMVVIADEVGGSSRLGFQLGEVFPIHACASGKAILATLPQEERQSLLGPGPLRAVTDETLTDIGALEEELERTQERGYAVNRGESNPGIISVATVVRAPVGQPIGALAISDAVYRAPPVEQMGRWVLEAGSDLEDDILGNT